MVLSPREGTDNGGTDNSAAWPQEKLILHLKLNADASHELDCRFLPRICCEMTCKNGHFPGRTAVT